MLIGHSIGGMTIQTLVRNYPDFVARAVAGIVLLNTTYTDPSRTMVLSGLVRALRWPVIEPALHLINWLQPLAWLGAWQSYFSGCAHLAERLGFGPDVTRSQLEGTTLLSVRNPQGVLARGNLAMLRWDASSAMEHCPTPTLIIAGDKDIVTKPEASEVIANHTPDAQLQKIERAGHMGFLEKADTYHRAIVPFVESVSRKPRVLSADQSNTAKPIPRSA